MSASGSEALLAVRSLTRRFGPTLALRDASFDVRDGEVLGLIGPNGAGKTTLFECVAGTLRADAGSVSHRGRPVAAGNRRALLFYVADGLRPWAAQRTGWVLELVDRLFASPAGARARVIDELQLASLLDTRVGELSKGERKRILIAIALLVPRPLLMLDEPFDGLDLRQTRDVMAVLRREARQGRTLFLSIHQLGDAVRVCDRFVLLSGGCTVGEGTHAQLTSQAGLAAGAGMDEVFLALT